MKRLFTDDFNELTDKDIAYFKSELMELDELPENEITDDDIYNRFIDDLEEKCHLHPSWRYILPPKLPNTCSRFYLVLH